MVIEKDDIENLINIIDWAIMEGYRTENSNIMELFKKMIIESNINEKTDNYFKERYGIE